MNARDLRLLTSAAQPRLPRRGIATDWGYTRNGLESTHREQRLQMMGLITIDRHVDRARPGRERRRIKITPTGLGVLLANHPATITAPAKRAEAAA